MNDLDEITVGIEPEPGLKLKSVCKGHYGAIGRISWDPNSNLLASPSSDKTIRIWNTNSGEPLHVLRGYQNEVLSVAWSPDGNFLASVNKDGVYFWETSGWNLFRKVAVGMDTLGCTPDLGLSWSPDSQNLAAGFDSGNIIIYSRESYFRISKFSPNFNEHLSNVLDIAWSPKGNIFASSSDDKTIRIWDINKGNCVNILRGHMDSVSSIVWKKDGKHLYSSSYDSSIVLWNVNNGQPIEKIEGHISSINCISMSSDEKILASKGGLSLSSGNRDETFRLWNANNSSQIVEIHEVNRKGIKSYSGGISFHKDLPLLATLGKKSSIIRIWEIDSKKLSGENQFSTPIRYTSAKIVLVGDSNAGKSCLAMRLAEDRYPSDNEQGTTHGMRFWQMDAEKLYSTIKVPVGQRRDIVLWDFGGQEEYQLIHQMFLHDTTLALILIDPTRGFSEFEKAREWNKKLEKNLGNSAAVKILIGSKMDQPSNLLNKSAIEELCKECDFKGFYQTSAKNSRRIQGLRKAIAAKLDWDNLSKTSRPELFQRIRDKIEQLRANNEVVILLNDLMEMLKAEKIPSFDIESVKSVVSQLASQGLIAQTKLKGGEEAIVLQLPIIEKYAGSLVIAARDNPNGVPALEERLLGSPKIPLPGISRDERLPRIQETIILDCIAELLIQNRICFRHEGLLIFPTLFLNSDADTNKQLPHSVSLYYDFTGAIDNIYASLVAQLMISKEFGQGRLWPNLVEFDQPGQGVCGIRQIKRSGGLAHIDLFFSIETSEKTRDLFTLFVEYHLRRKGVEIHEHLTIKCKKCGEEIEERIIQANIFRGMKDIICPMCRNVILISEGVEKIREKVPGSDSLIVALRKSTDIKTEKDAKEVKRVMEKANRSSIRINESIKILHLSDLHFDKNTSPKSKLTWLLQDIQQHEDLRFNHIEYLVISGDVTDRGNEAGYEKGREFVSLLNERLGISAERCIFVPGNHDVEDLNSSYDWFNTEFEAQKAQSDRQKWHKEGNVFFTVNDSSYPNRLKKFSESFFHKIIQKPYPLSIENQGVCYFFPETGIQFLTFNSCWQIDQFHRKRSGLYPEAVANGIFEADNQINESISRGDFEKGKKFIRICVWHHSIQHREAMQNTEIIQNLQNAGVQICLHGDVHEINREKFRYWKTNPLHIVGAGSFGSPSIGRPESIPRLYNILEVSKELQNVRVHTRKQLTADGEWSGWNEWPRSDGDSGKLAYYDIELT